MEKEFYVCVLSEAQFKSYGFEFQCRADKVFKLSEDSLGKKSVAVIKNRDGSPCPSSDLLDIIEKLIEQR
jgi:hypothetical protein